MVSLKDIGSALGKFVMLERPTSVVQQLPKAFVKGMKESTIGEQLKKAEKLPQPLKALASPTTTGILGGTYFALKGAPFAALGTTLGVPYVAGLTKGSKTIDKAVTGALNREKAGEKTGEFLEDVGEKIGSAFDVITDVAGKAKDIGGKGVEFVKENPIIPIAAGGTILGLAGLTAAIKGLRSRSTTPSLITASTPVGAPVFTGGIPTAPAAVTIPKEAVIEKPAKPMKITQKVDIAIKNTAIGKRTTKKFIKNINIIKPR